MKSPRRIVFPSEPAHLAKVREGMRDFLDGSRFSEEEVARIIMAVDEACTNIIRHAHAGLPKPVRLEMKWLRDRLRFVLRDYGTPFHPLTVQSRDFQIALPGGYGLFIIGTVFDHVDYAPQAKGTRLTLEKLLPQGGTQSSL
jgi:anti-sigma regulatory factor (Ser/Thr protein kinase)